ncbi:MAG: hypothetical protein BWY70_01740 [Bacteroidetes bacterium ADurb.Bin408]|nr:MAG: hypothetical protein BWY70_01740 [Bacteroidetes bacterium ADurb.Bin408]
MICNHWYLLREIKAAAYYKKIPGICIPGFNSVLFKTPDGPNPIIVVLIVVVLVAIVEILVPRVVSIVLRRAPIVIISETANSEKVKAF